MNWQKLQELVSLQSDDKIVDVFTESLSPEEMKNVRTLHWSFRHSILPSFVARLSNLPGSRPYRMRTVVLCAERWSLYIIESLPFGIL